MHSRHVFDPACRTAFARSLAAALALGAIVGMPEPAAVERALVAALTAVNVAGDAHLSLNDLPNATPVR
jgi:hypothetical protein